MAGGERRGIVGFSRFLANPRVTVDSLIEGWGALTSSACSGRHVLAIQDTSEINFTTTPARRRGLGEIGKGNGRGVLLHAMLGLVAGEIWTREGRIEVPRAERLLADKESERWLSTAEAAKPVLQRAALVTEVSDRESDIYAKWARVPGPGFHILTRALHDRRLQGGGKLSTAPLRPAGEAFVELRARPVRPARTAHLKAGFAQVKIVRPANTREKGLPRIVTVSLVEVAEIDAPAGAEPILWRLLTTHAVADAAMAWRIVGWYQKRWTIEQFFRTLKQQGLQLEDSQLETAERLIKHTAIAARAAEIDTLRALAPTLEGNTALQRNPHPPGTLAWAAWIIAKLGGWDGYPKSKPPGPITFRHGLQYFRSAAHGWALRDV